MDIVLQPTADSLNGLCAWVSIQTEKIGTWTSGEGCGFYGN